MNVWHWFNSITPWEAGGSNSRGIATMLESLTNGPKPILDQSTESIGLVAQRTKAYHNQSRYSERRLSGFLIKSSISPRMYSMLDGLLQR